MLDVLRAGIAYSPMRVNTHLHREQQGRGALGGWQLRMDRASNKLARLPMQLETVTPDPDGRAGRCISASGRLGMGRVERNNETAREPEDCTKVRR